MLGITGAKRQRASELYGYLSKAVYRLDPQSHRIIWKYVLLQDEIGQSEDMLINPHTARVVNKILYVATNQRENGKPFLIALDTTDGSLLWRQPDLSPFVNTHAVYTLNKPTSGVNAGRLTAYNPRTGAQIWQRSYSRTELQTSSRGKTDYPNVLQLITVTDQVLYAIATYDLLDGQDILARYALSPTDGSILWQNSEAIEGWMPRVTARVVGEILYTFEYNLKPATFSVASNTQRAQAHVAAFHAATGQKLWQTPEGIGDMPDGYASLEVSSDLLYYKVIKWCDPEGSVASISARTLYALNLDDGTVRWKYEQRGNGMTKATLVQDQIYLQIHERNSAGRESTNTSQINVIALNAQTGALNWSTGVQLLDGTEQMPPPRPFLTFLYNVDMAPVALPNAVYYSTPGSRIYHLRPTDGKILNQFWVDRSAQTLISDRVVLFVAP